jgi:hypothetical protein
MISDMIAFCLPGVLRPGRSRKLRKAVADSTKTPLAPGQRPMDSGARMSAQRMSCWYARLIGTNAVSLTVPASKVATLHARPFVRFRVKPLAGSLNDRTRNSNSGSAAPALRGLGWMSAKRYLRRLGSGTGTVRSGRVSRLLDRHVGPLILAAVGVLRFPTGSTRDPQEIGICVVGAIGDALGSRLNQSTR